MIVYANEFFFSSSNNGLENIKWAIKQWLSKKIGPSFSSTKIIPFAKPFKFTREDTGPNEVMIIGTPDQATDYSLSINYRHNDTKVQGRAWFTRIGIERLNAAAPLRVTVLLETQEVSPQAATVPVTPSQPGIVYTLLEHCRLDSKTPGAEVKLLSPSGADEFKREVADSYRTHAVVVVSVDDFSEEPLVDLQGLRRRLVGLAQIYSIPSKRDAWKLRNGILPNYHTAWDGSIAVISPGRVNGTAHGRVYRNQEIDAIQEDTHLDFDRYLFSELTHRFNLAKSRRHIGDALVGRRLVAFKLAHLRDKAGDISSLHEIVDSYEKDRDEAKKQAEELEYKLLEVEIQNDKLRTQIGELEKQVRTFKYHLNQANTANRGSMIALLDSEVPMPDSLIAIPDWAEKNFPSRLTFTGRAERTLKNSTYEDLSKVASVFRILATRFFSAFSKEISFQDATESLEEVSARYSGKQSDVTAGMNDGYECSHEGIKYLLQKHIGLGSSRDPRYCFRLYFDWEPQSKRIVVLHAGVHLDTQST
jgi:hypothetical protein